MSFQSEESARDLADLKSYFISQYKAANKLCGLSGTPHETQYIAKINGAKSLSALATMASSLQQEALRSGYGDIIPMGGGATKTQYDAYASIASGVATKKSSLLGTERDVTDADDDGRTSDLVSAGTYAKAQVSAPATNEYDGIDPRIAQVLNSSASATIKNQAIAQINNGNTSSAADLIAWFKGASTTPYSVPVPGATVVPGVVGTPPASISQYSPDVQRQTMEQIAAGNTSSPEDIAAFINGGFVEGAYSVPAPPYSVPVPGATMVPGVVGTPPASISQYSPDVQRQTMEQIAAGNTSSPEDIAAFINGGFVEGAYSVPAPPYSVPVPGATMVPGVVGTPPASISQYSPDVQRQTMEQIAAGNTSSPEDIAAFINGGFVEAPIMAAAVDAATSIIEPPAAAPVVAAPPASISQYSPSVQEQTMQQIASGNTSSPENIAAFINGGFIAASIPSIAHYSQDVQNQTTAQIAGGNTSSPEDIAAFINGGRLSPPAMAAAMPNNPSNGGIGSGPDVGMVATIPPNPTFTT